MALKAQQKKIFDSMGLKVVDGKLVVDVSKLGIKEKELIDAYNKTEEVDFDFKLMIEGFNVLNDTELSEFKSKAKLEQKEASEKSLPEILAKAYKEEFGIKLETKDLKEVIKAIAAAKEQETEGRLKLTVDEQVKLKEADISTLKGNYSELEKQLSAEKTEKETLKNQFNEYKDNTDFSSLVSDKIHPILRPSDFRARLLEEEGISIKKVDGSWKGFKSDGTPIKNKTLDDISVTDIIADVLKRRPEYSKPEVKKTDIGTGGSGNAGGSSGGGNGGSGGGDGKILSMSAFKEQATKEKWNSMRQQKEYVKVASQEGFDPNS